MIDTPAALVRAVSHARRLPQTTRIALVAVCGLPLAWVTYEILYLVNPLAPRATTTWIAAYALGVARQHFLHRAISFHDRAIQYRTSLLKAYATSIVLGIVSTFANWEMTEGLGINHQVTWAICILGVGLADYMTMKLFVFRAQ